MPSNILSARFFHPSCHWPFVRSEVKYLISVGLKYIIHKIIVTIMYILSDYMRMEIQFQWFSILFSNILFKKWLTENPHMWEAKLKPFFLKALGAHRLILPCLCSALHSKTCSSRSTSLKSKDLETELRTQTNKPM